MSLDVMEDACTSRRFDELTKTEQHTVATYIDELARRDTVADQALTESIAADEEARESQVYAIPDAKRDRQTVMTLFELLERMPA